MLPIQQILVRVLALATLAGSLSGLSGCGQTGPLYLPTEPAAAKRATLPQILLPGTRSDEAAAPPPAAPASTPSSSSKP